MNDIIRRIVSIAAKKKEGHIGSSLSILDILIVLYGKNIINDNNKFVLSKGHASLGLYAVLEYYNLLSEDLDFFCDFDSRIGGHPSNKLKNIECSTGSLGHGFPIALGMALAKKIKKEDGNIYCLIGDGESNEGTIWETALLAAHHKLDNLICIMDHNKSGDRALTIDPVGKKFESFNWDVEEIDGHNQEEIINCLLKKRNKPTFILANTIKGKGISFMENNPEWHHKAPTEEDLIKIYKEILPNE
jgi:transketolase